tara:strand:+ start:770 stop:1375 length:606 start_codon:yes stop_codon:yes gene_type:complete
MVLIIKLNGDVMKILSLWMAMLVSTSLFASGFSVDSVHSTVGFKVKYMMLSAVQGQFNAFDGQVSLDNGEPTSIVGQIDASSIDTNNAKRDAHLRSDDFFNVAEYPYIRFKSKQIRKNDVGYVAIGDLEIHGITNQVSIPFTLLEPMVDGFGQERLALIGQIRINRKEYGIMYSKKMDNGGLVVDNFIDIDLNIQCVKKTK